MKAQIDENGVLTLISESPLEEYAITCWHKECAGLIDEAKHPLIDQDQDWFSGTTSQQTPRV